MEAGCEARSRCFTGPPFVGNHQAGLGVLLTRIICRVRRPE